MKVYAALPLVALALAVPADASGPPFKVALKAPTHTPKVNAKWRYEVRVTDPKGKPIRALLSLHVLDPFGGVHPVEFDCCVKKYIVNRPINGVFRDAAEFPPESRGFKLTWRVTVRAKGSTVVLKYWIRSQ